METLLRLLFRILVMTTILLLLNTIIYIESTDSFFIGGLTGILCTAIGDKIDKIIKGKEDKNG